MTKRSVAHLQNQIENLYKLRAAYQAASAKANAAEEVMKAAEKALIEDMRDTKVKTLRPADGPQCTLSDKVVPHVTDWAKLDAWAMKNKVMAIYQRRVTESTWNEYREAGTLLPGTESFTTYRLTWAKPK